MYEYVFHYSCVTSHFKIKLFEIAYTVERVRKSLKASGGCIFLQEHHTVKLVLLENMLGICSVRPQCGQYWRLIQEDSVCMVQHSEM